MARHLPFISVDEKKDFFKMICLNPGDGKEFVEYLMGHWSKRDINQWSIENEQTHIITQCAIEGFHHLLNKEFGKRPSVESMARKLYLLDQRMLNIDEARKMLNEGFKSKAKSNGYHCIEYLKALDNYKSLVGK